MTLATTAYERIRDDIIQGVFLPCAPLRLAELKDKYGMGFSPLREALNRLQSDRLVEATDLKGFRVAASSEKEMRDAMLTRIELEQSALAASIRLGGDDWEDRIVTTLHALKREAARQAQGGDLHELEARHYQFHKALVSACDSAWKLRFFEQLYRATERYRIPALLQQPNRSDRDIDVEHSGLAQAAIDRDADLAATLLSAHYHRTMDWIASEMQRTGG